MKHDRLRSIDDSISSKRWENEIEIFRISKTFPFEIIDEPVGRIELSGYRI